MLVAMVGFPLLCTVGWLSSVNTAMDTPFSFMPSRQIKGAVRQAIFWARLSGALADTLSKAAKATEA